MPSRLDITSFFGAEVFHCSNFYRIQLPELIAIENKVSSYCPSSAKMHAGVMLSERMEITVAVQVNEDCEASALGMLRLTCSFFPPSAEINACHMVLFPRITSKGSRIKDLVLYGSTLASEAY